MPPMKKSKDVVAMFVDHGLFIDVAVRLSQVYKKVYYCIPAADIEPFPDGFASGIGSGVEGIEVVPSIQGPWFSDIDLFVFGDNGFGLWQEDLVRQGKRVFGSRMGEELELDRHGCKQLMKSVGLPVGPYAVVKGISKLRTYLKENPDQYVKISKWRGLFESFHSPTYDLIKPKIDKLAFKLGPWAETREFIVEKSLPDEDMAEVGIDTVVVNGKYPKLVMAGMENKDCNYVAVYKEYDKLPECMTRFNTRTAPSLEDCGYCGPISTEARIGKEHKPFTLDLTCRFGAPPSGLYIEMMKNFPDVVWAASNGVVEEPVVKERYGVEVIMESRPSDTEWQPVSFPESLTRYVSLRNYCVVDGKYYIIPQCTEMTGIGSVVGMGNSLDESIDMAKEICDEIQGPDIECKVASLQATEKRLEQLDRINLNFFK